MDICKVGDAAFCVGERARRLRARLPIRTAQHDRRGYEARVTELIASRAMLEAAAEPILRARRAEPPLPPRMGRFTFTGSLPVCCV